MLVVFGGLPGTGKTTLAREAASRLRAAYLRIDAIEAALLRAGVPASASTSRAGYAAANAVARGCLTAGTPVVVDAVNPVQAARDGWIHLAEELAQPLRVVEVVCSDAVEHRRRVESRTSDVDGGAVPTWADVASREHDPWRERRLVVDTAVERPGEAVARIVAYVGGDAASAAG